MYYYTDRRPVKECSSEKFGLNGSDRHRRAMPVKIHITGATVHVGQ